jgi:hypothetical protein
MVSFSCVSYWTHGVLAYANIRLLGNAAKLTMTSGGVWRCVDEETSDGPCPTVLWSLVHMPGLHDTVSICLRLYKIAR